MGLQKEESHCADGEMGIFFFRVWDSSFGVRDGEGEMRWNRQTKWFVGMEKKSMDVDHGAKGVKVELDWDRLGLRESWNFSKLGFPPCEDALRAVYAIVCFPH